MQDTFDILDILDALDILIKQYILNIFDIENFILIYQMQKILLRHDKKAKKREQNVNDMWKIKKR